MNILMGIRDDIQQIADATAIALGTEVTIIDTDCILVAGSKKYYNFKGTKVNGNFVRYGLKSNKPIVIKNPGSDPLCNGCEKQANCPEMIDLGVPIKLNDETIGLISLVAFTTLQRDLIIKNCDNMINFINKMGELIANKAVAKGMMDRVLLLNKELEITINTVDLGIMTVDVDGRIRNINEQAKTMLRSHNINSMNYCEVIPEEPIKTVLQKGIRYNNYELRFERNGSRYHFIVSAIPINILGKVNGAVITIKEMADITQLFYEITGQMVNSTFDEIIGCSKSIKDIKERATKISHSNSTVFIRGESGTGKELFARAIHYSGSRSKYPFIAINCAALPETLLESELFGYDEGAFTGAKKGGKIGKFELANNGTIFLDEIGDMPLHLQSKLLRVLQEKRIERIGGAKSIPVDVRVMAATNRALEEMIRVGEFREDLYYRLNVIPLNIPPLRQRREDIALLVKFFIGKYNKLLKKSVKSISDEALSALINYDWPGNVRELENNLEYAINFESSDVIQISSLPDKFKEGEASYLNNKKLSDTVYENARIAEYKYIMRIIEKYGDTVEGKKLAAEELGISIATLYRKLKKNNQK